MNPYRDFLWVMVLALYALIAASQATWAAVMFAALSGLLGLATFARIYIHISRREPS